MPVLLPDAHLHVNVLEPNVVWKKVHNEWHHVASKSAPYHSCKALCNAQ